MMTRMKFAFMGVLLGVTAFLALSCASNPMQLTDNWRNSTYTGPAYKKIMVVAMTKQDDVRRSIEDEFARQLKARGIETATCHECIPDPDRVTREELAKVSQGMGIEAYLIVRFLGVGTEVQSFQAGSPSPIAASTGTDSMMNMQWFGPEPSMGKRSEVATVESRLFDGKTADLVWRSTVNAVNPSPTEGQISRFVSIELKALGEKNLIP